MENQNETQKNPQYKYASTREKLCFGIGAIGKDAICNLVGAFLMLYFTDTLYLAPAFVGILFFVARIWDAINDPMMGMIVDNTHTRFGKFRIWLVIGTLVNSVVFVLLFHSFNLSGTALYVYVSVMYILYGMTYTIMDVPYWSWLPAHVCFLLYHSNIAEFQSHEPVLRKTDRASPGDSKDFLQLNAYDEAFQIQFLSVLLHIHTRM